MSHFMGQKDRDRCDDVDFRVSVDGEALAIGGFFDASTVFPTAAITALEPKDIGVKMTPVGPREGRGGRDGRGDCCRGPSCGRDRPITGSRGASL